MLCGNNDLSCIRIMLKEKIKIVFIIDGLEFGGTQRQLLYLVESIDRTKFDVSLIYFTDEENFLPDLTNTGIRIVKIKKKNKIDFSLILKIRRVVKELETDILVTYLITADIWGRLAGFTVKGLKTISCKRNQNNLGLVKTKLMSLMDRYSDSIIANCYDVKKHVCISERLDESRVDIIHNGYDIAAVRKTDQLSPDIDIDIDNHILVGTVGRLVDVKDHEFFIKIADNLIKRDKNVVFVIVGGGPNYQMLSSLIKSLGHEDRIKLLGARSDALRLVKAFDLYISTSKREGFSNSVMEAMILGKALWTTNVGAAKDIIQHGVNGYLIDKKMNMEEIVELYDRTIEKKEDLMLNALDTSDNYSVSNMVAKYETLFEKLMLS